MGSGVGRFTWPLSWWSTACCALVCAACEPSHDEEPSRASADAGGASEDAAPLREPGLDEAGEPEAQIWVAPDAGSEADAADAAPPYIPAPVDICAEVPTSGRCRGEQEIELCAITTGSGVERIESHTCPVDQRCEQDAGRARCVLRTACSVGTTRCTAGALETCSGDAWQAQACATECVATPLGAFCADAAPTRRFEGRIQYERRLPNEQRSDWASPTLTPGRGLLVLSYHGEQLLDAVLSESAEGDQAGRFSVRVRAEASAADSVVVMAAGADANQALAFAVADPGFEPSLTARDPGRDEKRAAIWSYRFALSDVAARGQLTIREEHGSAACHVFERLRQVYTLARDHFGPKQPETVLVWLGIGTKWACRACSAWSPTLAFGSDFQHQIWLDGSRDQAYWSDPVTAHELGHYVMNAYGFPLGEGGPHYLGVPTHPGQAFSEGWATFFSSLARADSLYFDKQGGAFFWWDLDRRSYSSVSALWSRALPWLGLLQLMDENEAAAIMWQTYRAIGAAGPVLDAVGSERMRVAPFARGYTRRIWTNGKYPNVFDTTEQSLPVLADYLDALLCNGALEGARVSEIVEPRSYYPYPSESPLCR